MGDEFSDVIIFLDEDNSKKDMHVEIIEIGASFVTFKNMSHNLITIPMTRVLKIKRRSDESTV